MQTPQFVQRNLNWFFGVHESNSTVSAPAVDIEMGMPPLVAQASTNASRTARSPERAQAHTASSSTSASTDEFSTTPCGNWNASDLTRKLHGAGLSDADTRAAGDLIATLPNTRTLSECLLNPRHIDALTSLHQLGLVDLKHVTTNSHGDPQNAIQTICLNMLNASLVLHETADDEPDLRRNGVLAGIPDMIAKLAAVGISPDGTSKAPTDAPLQIAAHCEEPVRSKLFFALANAGTNPCAFDAQRNPGEDAFATLPLEALGDALRTFLQDRQWHSDAEKRSFIKNTLTHALARNDMALLDQIGSEPSLAQDAELIKEAVCELLESDTAVRGTHDLQCNMRLLKVLPDTSTEGRGYRDNLYAKWALQLASSPMPEDLKTLLNAISQNHSANPSAWNLRSADDIIAALVKNAQCRQKPALLDELCQLIKVSQPANKAGDALDTRALAQSVRQKFPGVSGTHAGVGWAGVALGALTGTAALATLATRHLIPDAPELSAPDTYCATEKNLFWSLYNSIKPNAMNTADSGDVRFYGSRGCLTAYDDDRYSWLRSRGNRRLHDDYTQDYKFTARPYRSNWESAADTVIACASDMLTFAGLYPQAIAANLVQPYADIWPKCVEVLKSDELKSRLDKSTLATGIVAGVTLASTGYSIYRIAQDSRYRSALNVAVEALSETAV